ncbi:hypothetical protein BGX26_006078, partial [Mortierella sp. AD094]
MPTNSSTWGSGHIEAGISHQVNFDTLTSGSSDPIKTWIAFFMKYGGFAIILGIPALIATVSFLARIRWLKLNRRPHNYGRTNIIYWPSQIFIASACVALLALTISLVITPGSSGSLLVGAILTLVAWMTAIPLNTSEHKYEVRSSNYLFTYYMITLGINLL